MGNSNELKNNLDQTTNMDEVRDEKKLTDDEVSEVAGGNVIALLGDLGNKLSAISQSTDVVAGTGFEVPRVRGPRP